MGIAVTYILFGVWATQKLSPDQQFTHYIHKLKQGETCYAEVISSKKTPTGNRCKIELLRNQHQERISGSMMIYISGKNTITPGKYLSFIYRGRQVSEPLLPAGFQFKTWLKHQNIERIQHLKAKDQLIVYPFQSACRKNITKLQNKIQEIYRIFIGSKNESAVAAALIFGIKDELNEDIVADYAATGTLHVLAVSGLHVGLVFLCMQLLAKPIRNRHGKLIFQLIGLWLYVFICGAEAAVLRAGMMFSMIAWGRSIKRRTSIYNNLGLSGFILLFIDPNELYNIGFLLSYTAVAGIAFLHPLLCQLKEFKHSPLQKGFEFAMVSVAAQLATLPVTLLYFHQFPVYFLISNFIIIPLTTLITYGGILLLLLSPCFFAASLTGKGLYHLINLCDRLNAHMSQWPYANIQHIYGSTIEVLIFSISLVFLVWALSCKSPKKLLLSGFLFSLFLAINGYRYMVTSMRTETICIKNSQVNIQIYIRGHAAKSYISYSGTRNKYTLKNVEDFLYENGVKKISIIENTGAVKPIKAYRDRVPE